MRKLAVFYLLVFALLLSACGTNPTEPKPEPKLSIRVDETVQPLQPTIPDEDGTARPLGRVTGSSGAGTDFVLNELLLRTDDVSKLEAFLVRWNGTKLGETGKIGDEPNIYRVKLDPSPAQVDSLLQETRGNAPELDVDFRVSNEAAAKLLAVALAESQKLGITVSPNFVPYFDDIASGSTSEAPTGENALYTPNAFTLPYMNQGSPQDIGVGAAWQLLQRAGRFSNRIPIAILDGGFAPNADFTANRLIFGGVNVPGSGSCSGTPCPWHGTMVTSAAMGLPDNGFGVAGPGGPVATLKGIGFNQDFFGTLEAIIVILGETVSGQSRIINMSFSLEIDLGVDIAVKVACLGTCPAPTEMFAGVTTALGATNRLLIASAGNSGKNVDNPGDVIEGSTTVPCELPFVVCVGGMGHNATAKDVASNFGSKSDEFSVDIYAPFWMWVTPTPDATDNVARLKTGTSFSAPFVAGVAALVWAADPGLSASQVWETIRATAHRGGVGSGGPELRNALAAVQRALGTPPTISLALSGGGTTANLNRQFLVNATVGDDRDNQTTLASRIVWSTDGAAPGSGLTKGYRFNSAGAKTITATVTDSSGQSSSASITVTVNNTAPQVVIQQPLAGSVFSPSSTVALVGLATDLNEGEDPGPNPLPCSGLRWTSSNTNDTFSPNTGGSGRTGTSCTPDLTLSADVGSRTLTLRSTDPQGLPSSTTVTFNVTACGSNCTPTVTIRITSPASDFDTDTDYPGYYLTTALQLQGLINDADSTPDNPISYVLTVKELCFDFGGTGVCDGLPTYTITSGTVTDPAGSGQGTFSRTWTPGSTIPEWAPDCVSNRKFFVLNLEATDSRGARGSSFQVVQLGCVLF
jgi:subtilisin family serine protease